MCLRKNIFVILKQYIFSYQQIHFTINILYEKYLCTKRPANVQISTFTDRSFIYNPTNFAPIYFFTQQKSLKTLILLRFQTLTLMPATGIEPVREVSPAGF